MSEGEDFIGPDNWATKALRATSQWWRPIIGWACTVNVGLVLVYLPLAEREVPADILYAMLSFDALVVGLRGWEKWKGAR